MRNRWVLTARLHAGLILGWTAFFGVAFAEDPPVMLSEGRLISLRQPTSEITFKMPYPSAGEPGQICGVKMVFEADMAPRDLIDLSTKLEVYEGDGNGDWRTISPWLGSGFRSYLHFPITAKNTYEVTINVRTADRHTLSDDVAEIMGDRDGFVGLTAQICR